MRTEITLRGERLHVISPYSPALIERFRSIPDRRFHGEDKSWSFPACKDILLMICDVVGTLPWMLTSDVRKIAEDSGCVPAAAEAVDDSVLNGHVFLTQPFEHQKKNLARLLQNDRWLISDEQGTGKSLVICNRITYFKYSPILILCPKSVCYGWQEQLWNHAQLHSVVVAGDKKKRQKLLMNQTFIKITNYETLMHSWEDIYRIPWAAIIGDEIHKCKNFSSKTCRLTRELSEKTKHFWGLSGTPAPNGLQDFFGVLSAIDPNLFPVKTKTAFEARYCVKSEMKPGGEGGPSVWKISGYRNVAELHGYVASITSRVTKDECLDLPPKIFSSRKVVLEGEQARVYKDLKNKAVATIKSLQAEGQLTIRNILTESLRLLQVVGGFVPDDSGQVHEIERKCKVEAMEDLLEEIGPRQVVIWCEFRAEVAFLKRWLEENYGSTVTLTGGVSGEDRAENIEAFRRGDARYFVGTAAAGGTGINGLTAADIAIYYSRGHNLATWLQSVDRLHRIGTVNTVNIIKLIGSNTVDEKVDQSLERKQSMQEMLLKSPEEMF